MRPDILKQVVAHSGRIRAVHTQALTLEEPFDDFAGRFAGQTGTVALLSGGELDCARYHILGADPWLSFTGFGRNMTLTVDDRIFRFEADPFDTLRGLIDAFRLEGAAVRQSIPIKAGLLGYLAYDLKDHLETLPRTCIDDLGLPGICFFAPSFLVVHDKLENQTRIHIPLREGQGEDRHVEPAAKAKAVLEK